MTRQDTLSSVRNFGLIAHVDAGKTTLTERILHLTGCIHDVGEVHHGNTVTDFDPREQQHGITIQAAAVSCAWRKHQLRLIDTPGHIDFKLEVERSLRVLDGAVVLFDGTRGVESQTTRVWEDAERRDVPRLAFVNKLDRDGADFERVVDAIEERFSGDARVVALPWSDGSGALAGVIDLIEGDWSADLPPAVDQAARRHRERLMELCADLDDASAEAYLAHGAVDPQRMLEVLREATKRGRMVPIVGGSAFRRIGVEALLDAVLRFLPSPAERAPVQAVDSDEARPPTEDAPLSALCFSGRRERHGYLTYVRVYSGVLRRGDKVRSAMSGKVVRVGRLAHVFAGKLEPVEVIGAGGIGAVMGLRAPLGDTLSDPRHPIRLEALTIPEPVVRMALEPESPKDHDALGLALEDLRIADPSLRVEVDGETSQVVLAGLGELHIEIAVERLREERGIVVATKSPRVSYREGLTQNVDVDFKLSKQTGGPGMFARVALQLGPADKGEGLVFVDARRGDDVPTRFVSAVERGVRDAMACGPLAGFPIPDARVVLLGGAAHSNDSSELAFSTAAKRAFVEGAGRASPVLLEPVVRVEVSVTTDYVGTVTGDLASRRGQIVGLDHEEGTRVVHARAPLSEMFGYARRLLSMTHGHGSFATTFDGYEHVPPKVTRALLAKIA